MQSSPASSAPLSQWALEVVVELDLQHLTALGYNHLPGVVPEAIDLSEAPELDGGPAVGRAGGSAQNVRLAVGANLLIEPSVLLEVVQGVPLSALVVEPLVAAHQRAEDVVLVSVLGPVELAVLSGTLNATSGCRRDVNVGDVVNLGLLDGEGDGGKTDGLALEPSDALEGEDGLGIVGESLGLFAGVSRGIGECARGGGCCAP